ncbi:hypothetical protein AKO1_013613 [Acrasis kona]|uniref:Fe2OG dioxygenase domain-containing protein n=1 Tax=Acrasis kona TaxID=1008807 RepID=A0AAW2YVT7_9EUKA
MTVESYQRVQSDMVFDRIKVLFDSFGGSNYIGESVSITEHSLQAAYFTAKKSSEDEVIIASLLHDVGHILGLEIHQKMEMDGCGVEEHESVGANFLKKLGFCDRVCNLTRCHVQAKRYLCFKRPEYYQNLSEASKTTLKFQGGPMSVEESSSFESDSDFQNILLMRECDEAAKIPSSELTFTVPPLEHYRSMMASVVDASQYKGSYVLSDFQKDFFNKNSFVKIENLLSFENIAPSDVSTWTQEVSNLEKQEGKWLQHWEKSESGDKIMCRSENFVNFHENMRNLAMNSILNVVSQLFGEKAVLFKEKINYKLPGGAGFAAHQDSPAYIGLATDHISVMVAIDEATVENGCLQVCPGQWDSNSNVPLTSSGIITPEAEKAMVYQYVPCRPGDVLFFGGYTPHRSTANNSKSSRRAMFLTYNPESQGQHHAAYYQAKHAKVQGFDGAHTISFQGDFQGQIVE